MQNDVFKRLRERSPISDEEFDSLFPVEFHEHSHRHYTSVFIAQKAIDYLTVDPNSRIIDIGSGTGKFCLIGAARRPNHFTGVEYRPAFVEAARQVVEREDIYNAQFICDTILNIDFSDYDHFYMFNPFLEHKDQTAKIDLSVSHFSKEYEVFRSYVYEQFSQLQIGTRVATYYVGKEQLPESYEQVASFFGDTLRFWEKRS
ncbi:MAG: class I SAM-dependent methyltransferase [Flavobacteriia bacterium]|jgi:tRNA G46 methylase TrmB